MASEGSGCKTGDALILDPLDTDTVSVRWLSLEAADAGHLSRWRRMLDDSELRRANSYNFAPDRETFITAHALTRAMLSSATGKPTTAWRYVGGEFGKPYLAPGCTAGGLQFNLSHARGFVACAVAYREVGVDVESTDRLTDIDIADLCLLPRKRCL
jgi:4'-phosphopantetheinyl transferase